MDKIETGRFGIAHYKDDLEGNTKIESAGNTYWDFGQGDTNIDFGDISTSFTFSDPALFSGSVGQIFSWTELLVPVPVQENIWPTEPEKRAGTLNVNEV